ncbi:MAG TPA: histidinol dehydrogenase [Solirubrobacteraceae bacterium]|nr:histidinol dehydrogenase [Solirubrobacteraceae bacterium]
MRVERFRLTDVNTAAAAVERIRALVPAGRDVRGDVETIVDAVHGGGDEALREYAERFDRVEPGAALRVPAQEIDAAAASLRSDLRYGLELAMVNIAAVAGASLGDDRELRLNQGQRVLVRELPVDRAAIYAPGGRNPYPSTVLMGVVTARVAGVDDIAVLSPGAHPVVLAACALCGVDEVYRVGGAHAVAAAAYGTETIRRADVIAGPGGLHVQEAKRHVSGDVGIDGFLGPSDVFIVASGDADPELVLADLLAQAEHGAGTIVGLATDSPALIDAVEGRLAELDSEAVGGLVDVDSLFDALAVSEAFAPEHLELMGRDAEPLAPAVRRAGAIFVGGGTAFGDYVAGSNHSLPTGGSARFGSALSVRHFRRRMAEVHIGRDAAATLAKAGAPVARAEGFELHARSMEARQNGGTP